MIFDKASAKLKGDDLVVEFTARRDRAIGYDVIITPDPMDFRRVASNTAHTARGTDDGTAIVDGGVDVLQAVSDATPPTHDRVRVDIYTKGKIVVTISGLQLTQEALSNRVSEVKIAEGTDGSTHYETTLTVGGPVVSGPGDDDDTDPPPGTTDDSIAVPRLGATAGKPNNKADAAVSVTLNGTATKKVAGGTNLVVTLPKFQIPEGGIDRSNVIIDGDSSTTTGNPNSYYGHPESVSVSGSAITLRLPVRYNVGTTALAGDIRSGAEYTVTFLREAGLKNPNAAGEQTIVLQDADSAASNHKFDVTIISHVAVDPAWVSRGEMVTVTGKGITAIGDATVHLYIGDTAAADLTRADLDPAMALNRAPMDGGTAAVVIDTSSSKFQAAAKAAVSPGKASGTNVVAMVDSAGNVTGTAVVGLTPKVELDVTEVRRSGKMKVTLSDWYYGGVGALTVNGIQVMLPDGDDLDSADDDWPAGGLEVAEGKKKFDVIVHRNARLGEMEVKVSGTTYDMHDAADNIDFHKQTVNVGAFDLTITPSTAVTDQVIRIEGSGFGESVCIVEIMVGDEYIKRATTGDRILVGNVADCVRTNTDGDLANSFKVPYNLKPDDYPVVVRDSLNRVGEAMLTVPKPVITLEPEASQRGSTVTVVGSNFAAEDVIGITYDGDTVTVATTDTVGKWRQTFKVPVDATIGKEYEVVATSDKKGDGMDPDRDPQAGSPERQGAPHRAGRDPDGLSGSGILRPAADGHRRATCRCSPGEPAHWRHPGCR